MELASFLPEVDEFNLDGCARDDKSQSNRSWHCGTIHHRITETLKGAQYGTLKIPLSTKVTNDTSEHVPEASCLSRGTPDLSQTPFLTGLPGPDPLTSKRHPETGLQAPRDHRVMEQALDDLSKLYRVSRWTFQWSQTPPDESSGHIHGKQRSQRSPNTSRHSGNTEEAPVTSP
ncbi:hypothetical protein CDL15_Pgr019449 [Punica granatum]|uniref:Uncharacterized protein n=1 Tax=Punica granatum TaxID=22663 RepID=A0A218WEN6_PUNGR|nr:hypothetical protein CDL15_Pgr019449 [Punica granatum]